MIGISGIEVNVSGADIGGLQSPHFLQDLRLAGSPALLVSKGDADEPRAS